VTTSYSAAIRAPRAPIFSGRAMVVSGNSAASLAAIAVLKRGGHVVDAMVAVSAVLTTVLGHATSIGGDCFLLFHDSSTGRTIGLNASGTAPAGATPERFPDGAPRTMSMRRRQRTARSLPPSISSRRCSSSSEGVPENTIPQRSSGSAAWPPPITSSMSGIPPYQDAGRRQAAGSSACGQRRHFRCQYLSGDPERDGRNEIQSD